MSFNFKQKVFRVYVKELPESSKEFNHGRPGEFFESRIVSIFYENKRTALVTVETKGSYPYIENEWEKFIIKDLPNAQA